MPKKDPNQPTNPAVAFNAPFDLQVEFLRRKLDLPTATWRDIWQGAHDRAFVVAGATKADLLADLHAAVVRAAEEGRGIEAFRAEFDDIVARNGWRGWTGDGSDAGVAWRTRVIYQTNMATSYAAGRWAQVNDPDLADFRPYIKYHHADGVLHPRPLHVAWNGLVLPKDHPFWQTHAPPNGWGCHCYVSAAGKKDYEAAQAAGRIEPPAGWREIDDKTGAPMGIDKGWAYNPGAQAATPLRELVEQKLLRLEAPIGAAMWESLAPAVAMEQRLAMMDLVDAAATSMQSENRAALAHVASPATVADLAAHQVPLATADIWLRDTELIHALRETKDARGATLSLQAWRDLPTLLQSATPYLDTADTALVYVFDVPEGIGKVAVRVNYTSKVNVDGGREKLTSNFIRTGSQIRPEDIIGHPRYLALKK